MDTTVRRVVAGARQLDRLVILAGVPLDRAAVALLRQVADSEPLRPGDVAVRMQHTAAELHAVVGGVAGEKLR
ncbi:hypothetical protein ACWDBW_06295 [Streptomyces sp. NPDC001107]